MEFWIHKWNFEGLELCSHQEWGEFGTIYSLRKGSMHLHWDRIYRIFGSTFHQEWDLEPHTLRIWSHVLGTWKPTLIGTKIGLWCASIGILVCYLFYHGHNSPRVEITRLAFRAHWVASQLHQSSLLHVNSLQNHYFFVTSSDHFWI